MRQLSALLIFIISIFIITPALSQTKEELEEMRQEFEAYKKQERENFKQFVEERDRDFAAYLEQEMKNIELFKSRKQERKPGPDKIPRFRPEKQKIENNVIPLFEEREIEKPPVSASETLNKKPEIKLPENIEIKPDIKLKTAEFNFYGTDQVFHYDPEIHQNPGRNSGTELISAYFKTLSKTNYFPLIESLIERHNKYNLNDWAYLKLCENLAENIAVTEREKNLLHWFLLIKSGYKAKVAWYEDQISLMIPTKQALYGLPFYSFNDQTYYILDPGMERIFTYKKDYPGAEAVFDMNMHETPVLPLSPGVRKFTTEDGEKFKVVYNKNLKALYDDFPQADINLLFQAGMSPIARESLLNYFEPRLKNKDTEEKINFMLGFVQHQFDYKTDQQQFGKEKFFFPEELFMYPYADCEDRSVLFAWLVREFTDLDIIGLDYPGHIATAVHFPAEVEGNYLSYQGKRFTVCDPTFIGAPAGMPMPEFANQKASVIPVRSFENTHMIAEKIWAKIYEYGGFRNNIEQTAAVDNNGNIYLCGSFNKNMRFPHQTLSSNQKRSGFVAAFSPNGDFKKAVALDDAAVVSPENLLVQGNDIFVSGKQNADSKDEVFVQKFNASLKPVWHETIKADKTSKALEIQLDAKGNQISNFNINPLEVHEDNALRVLSDGSLQLHAHKTSPVYHKEKPAENLSAYDMAKIWKKQSNEYREQAYHTSVSGLLGFINTIQTHQRDISGNEIVASLNAFDSNFSTKYASLNHNLKKIDKIICDDDMLTVRIKDGKSITLGSVILSDNCKIKLKNYHSGNLKMIFLSGARYKSLFREYPVHSVKIFKANGDMLVEYNKKHEQTLLSTAEDILK
ncbi:MAG: hypothetical protein R6V32_05040 [Bacteroidales bacterium]